VSHFRIRRDTEINRFYAAAVDKLPGYREAWVVAEQAEQRLEQLPPVVVDLPSPLHTGELTDAWLELQVDNELAVNDREARRRILTTLRNTAHSNVTSTVAAHADAILSELHRDLLDIIGQGRDRCADLGDARTPADAIATGITSAQAWASMAPLIEDYRLVRAAQFAAMTAYPDETQSARSSNNPDNRASDLLLANLDELSPTWRSPNQDYAGHYVWAPPWPEDETEYFIWLCTSDAEPWIPTRAELQQLWQDRAPAPSKTAAPPITPHKVSHGLIR
jgi:hypothetical protein